MADQTMRFSLHQRTTCYRAEDAASASRSLRRAYPLVTYKFTSIFIEEQSPCSSADTFNKSKISNSHRPTRGKSFRTVDTLFIEHISSLPVHLISSLCRLLIINTRLLVGVRFVAFYCTSKEYDMYFLDICCWTDRECCENVKKTIESRKRGSHAASVFSLCTEDAMLDSVRWITSVTCTCCSSGVVIRVRFVSYLLNRCKSLASRDRRQGESVSGWSSGERLSLIALDESECVHVVFTVENAFVNGPLTTLETSNI